MYRKRARGILVIVSALVILLAAVVVLPVFGQPPQNDERTAPTVVGTLPFAETVDTTAATQGFDDPYLSCPSFFGVPEATVWYSYTPDSAATIVASTIGSSYATVVAVLDSFGGQIACGSDTVTASVNPGESYLILVGATGDGYPGYPGPGGGGTLEFSLDLVAGPDNDDFAAATSIAAVPFTEVADLSAASSEAGEPVPNCAYFGTVQNTVWYAFTPAASGSYSVQLSDYYFEAFVAVYSGSSLLNLNQLDCRNYFYGDLLTVPMNAGTTYYFQVGNVSPYQQPATVRFTLDVPPPPVADFAFWPNPPSQFDQVQFNSFAYDPAGIGLESYSWEFGDGTTAAERFVSHSYPADGQYVVEHTVTTFDGRTDTVTRTLSVETHDVAITHFRAPNAAKAGQTRNITVGLTNSRYDESVTVYLYRSTTYGYELVGTLTSQVPVRPGNRTTDFDFSYTFTEADAAVGTVTFRAEARINQYQDALPANNEAISPPTNVNP